MVIVKCPHCGNKFALNIGKCEPKKSEDEILNEIMTEIALEQSFVESYI